MGTWAATAFGVARALTVDPNVLGEHPVAVEIQVPDLATFRNIPLIQQKWVVVTVSTHSACPADPKQLPKLTELGVGVLTVKAHEQSVQLPGDADLAVFAESTEQGGGNSVWCTSALRFHSEAGKHYRVRFQTPQHWHMPKCRIGIVEIDGDKELPVASAHEARATPAGLIKGGDLNVCAESGAPTVSPAAGESPPAPAETAPQTKESVTVDPAAPASPGDSNPSKSK
jgi:hypothetical protein